MKKLLFVFLAAVFLASFSLFPVNAAEIVLGEASFEMPDDSGIHNAKLAAEMISGTVLQPGEEFSFNAAVGERLPERGFVLGPIIVGKKKSLDYGGGICRTSTALYMAAKRAGLEVVERHKHSIPAGYVPYEDEAAVSWGRKDFRFVNNHDNPVKLIVGTDGTLVSAAIVEILPEPEQKQEPEQKTKPETAKIQYGVSGLGRPLEALVINPDASRTALLVFGLHGWEDAWDRDGQELKSIAEAVYSHFAGNPETLSNWRLLIIPSANPDGLEEGWTAEGPGRCQVSMGIDLNRDFDFNFKRGNVSRNRTGAKPFTAPESQALRDLILQEKPEMLIDFHGWLGCAKYNLELAKPFEKHLGIEYTEATPSGMLLGQGQLAAWASAQGIKSLLVEYPDPVARAGRLVKNYGRKPEGKLAVDGFAEKTILALEEIFTERR